MNASPFTKSITVLINEKWHEKNKASFADPLGMIFDACKTVFPEGIEMKKNGPCNCEMLVGSNDLDDNADRCERIEKIVKGIAKETLRLESITDVVTVSVTKLGGSKSPSSSVQERINSLIGAEDFKKLADEVISIAPQIKKHSTQKVFASQSYIFSINDGCGLSTYLDLFAELLSELDIFDFRSDNKIVEVKLTQKNLTDAPDAFMGELASFKRSGYKRKGFMFCIDISEWMSKTDDKDFRSMLSLLDDHTTDNIFIFRIPFVEEGVLKRIKNSLSDLLFMREVSFTPFDIDQLERCAEMFVQKNGYSMAPDAWEIFDTRIAEEKSDGRFYGINTVNKVASEIIYRKQLSNALMAVDNTLICKSDILSLAETYMQEEKSASEMLSELIGMEDIAKRVQEIVTQIKVHMSGSGVSAPCLHMQFIGNPGTGKTTVARIIGKLLKENGVLRNGSFFEYGGRDLCGKFVGETAPKTAAICRDSYGSVLFIDEAYSLYRGSDDYRDFGREALDTLIAEMENHRSDLVVIMAGYGDEMQMLMQSNPGLKSRMPFVINFPNYTRWQLFEIFRSMLESSFGHDEHILPAASEYFDAIPDKVLNSKEFANARFVRNLFERTWGKAAMRSRFGNASEVYVTKEDFLQACAEKEFALEPDRKPRSFGFR